MTKDTYLESLYSTLEMCDLVLQNRTSFTVDRVERVEKLRQETQEWIRKREAIPSEQRI